MVDFAALRQKLKDRQDALVKRAMVTPVTRLEYDAAFINPPASVSFMEGAAMRWWTLRRPEPGKCEMSYKDTP